MSRRIHTRAAWFVAVSFTFGRSAFADEPPKKPAAPDGPKETEPATPQTNPWADAGLSKRREGQQPASAAATTRRERPSQSDASSKPISAAILVGYASENYRFGLGVQAGYSIYGFYVGATFVYHLGTSQGEASASVFYPGLELGYDLPFEEVVVRPYLGVDYVLYHVSLGSQGTSKGYLGVHPGVHVDYVIPDTPAFVGIDARVMIIPDVLKDATPSIGVFLVGGARF